MVRHADRRAVRTYLLVASSLGRNSRAKLEHKDREDEETGSRHCACERRRRRPRRPILYLLIQSSLRTTTNPFDLSVAWTVATGSRCERRGHGRETVALGLQSADRNAAANVTRVALVPRTTAKTDSVRDTTIGADRGVVGDRVLRASRAPCTSVAPPDGHAERNRVETHKPPDDAKRATTWSRPRR